MARNFSVSGVTILPVPGLDDGISGCTDIWMFDQVTAARNVAMRGRFRRAIDPNPESEVALRLRLFVAGEADGIVDEEPIRVRPGDIVIHSTDVPMALDIVDAEILTLGLSTSVLAFDSSRHARFSHFRAGSAEADMVAALISQMFYHVEGPDAAKTVAVCQMMLAGLGDLIRLGETQSGEPDARSAAMRRHIDMHIANPDFGLQHLQDEFPASRAVIYRDFESEGGVATYIARRRMRRALSLLTLANAELTIGDVARAVGYRDQRRFSRVFTRHFGLTPTRAKQSFDAMASEAEITEGSRPADALRFRAMLDFSETQ